MFDCFLCVSAADFNQCLLKLFSIVPRPQPYLFSHHTYKHTTVLVRRCISLLSMPTEKFAGLYSKKREVFAEIL